MFRFCIDIGSLYNFSHNPKIKTKLRTLANIFLGLDIQNSKAGHCSIQDSLATLKLLKLKLDKGIVFGNVTLGWNFSKWCKENNISEFGTRLDPKNLMNNLINDSDSLLNKIDMLLNNDETSNSMKTHHNTCTITPESSCRSPIKLEIASTLLSNFNEIRAKTPKQLALKENDESLFDFKQVFFLNDFKRL